MDTTPRRDTSPRPASRRRWPIAVAALAVAAAALLYANHRHNRRHTWQPVRIPLRFEAGATQSADFAAELDEVHQLEVAFDRRIDRAHISRYITTMEAPSALDVRWSVSDAEGRMIAKGDCRDYLYVIDGYDDVVRRTAKIILNYPLRQNLWGQGGGMARGVGQFEARAGLRYTINVTMGTSAVALDVARPRFNVRVNERRVREHFSRTAPLSTVGWGAGAAAALLVIWHVVRERRRQRGVRAAGEEAAPA